MLIGRRNISWEAIVQRAFPSASRPGGHGLGLRLLIGLVLVVFALCSYFGSSEFHPV